MTLHIVEDDDEPLIEIENVDQAVELLLDLKAELEEQKREIAFVENWIDNAVKLSTVVTIGDKQYKTTPVRSKTTTINTEALTRLMPSLAAQVITEELVEKVNVDRLAKEIEKGNVPIDLMKQFVSQKPKKTSIRVTEYVAFDDEEDEVDDDE